MKTLIWTVKGCRRCECTGIQRLHTVWNCSVVTKGALLNTPRIIALVPEVCFRSESTQFTVHVYCKVRKVWKIRQAISKHIWKLISNAGVTDAYWSKGDNRTAPTQIVNDVLTQYLGIKRNLNSRGVRGHRTSPRAHCLCVFIICRSEIWYALLHLFAVYHHQTEHQTKLTHVRHVGVLCFTKMLRF